MDDELMRTLGRLARDEEERPAGDEPPWAALVAGELSEEQVEAMRVAVQDSPEDRARFAALQPLGTEFQERLVERLRSAAEEEQARRPPWRRTVGWLAAAGLLLALSGWLLRPVPSLVPLPEYQLELVGGVSTERSPAAEPTVEAVPELVEGSRLEVRLRPQTAVSGALEARVFLIGSTGPEPWPVPVEVAPSGAVRIVGTIGRELPLAAGDWPVLILVGRPDRLPPPEEALVRSRSVAGEWLAVQTRLRVTAAAP